MAKILVAFDSGYGATAAASGIVTSILMKKGLTVDLIPVDLADVSGYDALFLGSPVRLGRCTPKIKRFLKKNRDRLSDMSVAFFFTCMSVTGQESDQEFPLFIDPSFSRPDKPGARIRWMEENHTATYYLRHFLKQAPGVTPKGAAFFKGRLNTENLSLVHGLIMRVAMYSLPEIENGDFLNPAAIESWTHSLCSMMVNG